MLNNILIITILILILSRNYKLNYLTKITLIISILYFSYKNIKIAIVLFIILSYNLNYNKMLELYIDLDSDLNFNLIIDEQKKEEKNYDIKEILLMPKNFNNEPIYDSYNIDTTNYSNNIDMNESVEDDNQIIENTNIQSDNNKVSNTQMISLDNTNLKQSSQNSKVNLFPNPITKQNLTDNTKNIGNIDSNKPNKNIQQSRNIIKQPRNRRFMQGQNKNRTLKWTNKRIQNRRKLLNKRFKQGKISRKQLINRKFRLRQAINRSRQSINRKLRPSQAINRKISQPKVDKKKMEIKET